ncbi:MAG: hypothetical protein KKB37_14710 [Alphaproteobacteria bacterium]|nr:hypothetical protein [Alphaproteobacteria bacterium]
MSGVSAFLWQAALLLLIAYFLGAWLGCLLRRWLTAPPKVAMETNAAATASAARLVVEGTSDNRFSQALEGMSPQYAGMSPQYAEAPSQPASAPFPTHQPPAPAEPPPTTPAARAATAGQHATTQRPGEPAKQVPPAISPVAPPAKTTHAQTPAQARHSGAAATKPAHDITPPMTAAAAAAAMAARRIAERQESQAEPPLQKSVAARMESLPPREPVARRSISTPGADRPNTESRFVLRDERSRQDALPRATGSGEQATVAARVVQREPTPTVAAVPVVPAAPAETGAVTSGDGDDLTLIDGVTPDDVRILNDAGVHSFKDIASWTAPDVRRMTEAVGGGRRIARQNWIEQAHLLASGASTAYALRSRAHLVPRPDVPPVAPAVRSPLSRPAVSERAAFSRELSRYRENLQRINGINAEVQKLLNDQGVARIAQIADWSDEEADRLDRLLGGTGRIRREDWIAQARRLSGRPERMLTSASISADAVAPQDLPATDTDDQSVPAALSPETAESDEPKAASVDETPVTVSNDGLMAPSGERERATPGADPDRRDSADNLIAARSADSADDRSTAGDDGDRPANVTPLHPRQASPVPGLRSVRSAALVKRRPGPDGANDDLKRIRGIGVLIEKRLHAMGFTTFEQIGSWTQSDIDRVSQTLDFRGRIERENWIEQARILAAGGQTEFSRRQESKDT